MSELSFSPARCDTEVEQALELAVRTFRQFSPSPDYHDFKVLLWKEDPSYRAENLLLAKTRAGRIVGLIRLVPRLLLRVNETYSAAGVSSVCLDPEFHGRGLSTSFMQYALNEARNRGFDLCFLIARRAADHYYTRFGFWGISSYNRVAWLIREKEALVDSGIVLAPGGPDLVKVYSAAHLASYRGCFGRFDRSLDYWRFLMRKIARFPDTKWLTILVGNRPAGYVIHSNAAIHEVAYLDGVSPVPLLGALRTALQGGLGGQATVSAEIPPQHRLFTEIRGIDTSLTFRECSYGGHMVRILNAQRIGNALANRVQARLRNLGSAQQVEECGGVRLAFDGTKCEVNVPTGGTVLSYEQTCWLLGVRTLSSPATADAPLPFNISLPDQV